MVFLGLWCWKNHEVGSMLGQNSAYNPYRLANTGENERQRDSRGCSH